MANDYFDSSDYTALVANTLVRASSVNAIIAAIEAAFDKLPSLKSLNENRITYAADSGAANAYVVTLAKVPTEYNDGLTILMKVGSGNTNTGASTINVNGLGAKDIHTFGGGALTAGVLNDSRLVLLSYVSPRFYVMAP